MLRRDCDLQGPDPYDSGTPPSRLLFRASEPNSRRPCSHSHIYSAIHRNVRESGGNRAELWLESRTIGRSLAGRRSSEQVGDLIPGIAAADLDRNSQPNYHQLNVRRKARSEDEFPCPMRSAPNQFVTRRRNPRRQEPLRSSVAAVGNACVAHRVPLPDRPVASICAVNEPLGLTLINPRHGRSLPSVFREYTIWKSGRVAGGAIARNSQIVVDCHAASWI